MKAFIAKIRAALVDDLALMRKRWSFWLHMFAVLLYGYATELPDQLNEMWRHFPDDLKMMIGPDWGKRVAVALFVAGFVATFIKQKRLTEQREALVAAKQGEPQ